MTVVVCANCHQRPGTELWVGGGGLIGYAHGFSVMWCKRCVLEAQLEHALQAAESIPRLRRELEKEISDQPTVTASSPLTVPQP